ncbi:hypothetical protein EI613_16495 [Azospirillum sp. 412522]|nr:hypothetical protein [Azospirillum sp. 412522]MBY6263500.1 hypothetical protein [Azospirillum sp. 412522]
METRPISRRPLVVAVSGPSGAGKSSLIEAAAGRLGRVVRLHFDHYVTLGNDIGTIAAWLEGGADPDQVATPRLVDDLRRLVEGGWIEGSPIERPPDGARPAPADVVILEEPFGRSRAEIGPLIDLAVHIDVPSDVALARRTLRLIGELRDRGGTAALDEAEGQLRAFLAAGREAYLSADRSARGTADLVLDGMRPVEALAGALLSAIAARRPR